LVCNAGTHGFALRGGALAERGAPSGRAARSHTPRPREPHASWDLCPSLGRRAHRRGGRGGLGGRLLGGRGPPEGEPPDGGGPPGGAGPSWPPLWLAPSANAPAPSATAPRPIRTQ